MGLIDRVLVLGSIAIAASGLEAGPARALDLATAWDEVTTRSPALAARRSWVEAARARVAPAGAWPAPMIELGVTNVPTRGGLDMDPMTMKMVGLSQRLPLFGSNRLGRGSAREAVAAERAGVTRAHHELLGATWEAYAEAYHAGERARAAAEHRALMDRMVESARARYDSGRGRLEDVLRAEAERSGVLADGAAFQAEEGAARARLDALRGIDPGGTADTLAPPPVPAVPDVPGPWLAAVEPGHPRLREIEAQARRYRLSARAARRMVWPDLELRGSYGFREPLHGTHAQDDMFSATVALMLPVFARSRELSEAAEMDAMARAADAERRAAELELGRQLAAVHAAAAAARRTVRLFADTVVVVQSRAVDASWSAYTAGSTDLWRVLEAAHSLYRQEIALSRAREQLARAHAQMLSLTGRGDLLGVALPSMTEDSR